MNFAMIVCDVTSPSACVELFTRSFSLSRFAFNFFVFILSRCFLCYTDISKLLIVHQNPLSLSKRSTLQQVISNKLKKQQTATFTHFTLWRILNDTIIGIMNPVVIMNILHPLSSLDVIRRNPSFWEAVGSRCKCI